MEVVANKYVYCTVIFHGGPLNVHKVDCLGEETVLVPGCPGNCGSVAPA